jgi:hypothetical protein
VALGVVAGLVLQHAAAAVALDVVTVRVLEVPAVALDVVTVVSSKFLPWPSVSSPSVSSKFLPCPRCRRRRGRPPACDPALPLDLPSLLPLSDGDGHSVRSVI